MTANVLWVRLMLSWGVLDFTDTGWMRWLHKDPSMSCRSLNLWPVCNLSSIPVFFFFQILTYPSIISPPESISAQLPGGMCCQASWSLVLNMRVLVLTKHSQWLLCLSGSLTVSSSLSLTLCLTRSSLSMSVIWSQLTLPTETCVLSVLCFPSATV